MTTFFTPQLILQWFINSFFKVSEAIFRGGPTFSGGGPTFPRGVVQFFQGGGGVLILICIEAHRTCDFPGAGPDPLSPPLDPHMEQIRWAALATLIS